MAKVKYRVREYTPTANQGGTHSFFAEAVINTDITVTERGTGGMNDVRCKM